MLRLRPFIFCLLLAYLLFSLASCDSSSTNTASSVQNNTNKGDSNTATIAPTLRTTQSSGSTSSTTIPKTEISCPEAGTVRPAIIAPMTLGNSQNLVYSYMASDGTHLRRYDTATGQKTDISTLSNPIDYPQISNDGQWILFLAKVSNTDERLELVRMDGQGLQTLYCFPQDEGVLSLQWSPDQNLVAYSVQMNNATAADVIGLLNISSGTQKTLFHASNSDFYGRITWLDNTHLYIDKEVRANSSPGTLYLIDVTTASVSNPGLQTVVDYTANPGRISYKGDSQNDKLYFADICQASAADGTTITTYSATGGTQQAQFHVNGCVFFETISADSLFLLFNDVATGNMQIEIVHTDGSAPYILTTLSTSGKNQQIDYKLHSSSEDWVAQSPWFNFSRDGNTYALEKDTYGCDSCSTQDSILIGSMNGNDPTAIATADHDSLSVVGWTTM